MLPAHIITILTMLMLGVVYGTDVFFAVVGRSALPRVSDASLTEVMGRLHEVADRRMPFFGVLGIIGTLSLVAIAPSPTSIVALGAQLIHLGIYFRVSIPVNVVLTAAATRGEPLTDAPQLQRRWDSVIVPRALILGLALLCVALTGIHA